LDQEDRVQHPNSQRTGPIDDLSKLLNALCQGLRINHAGAHRQDGKEQGGMMIGELRYVGHVSERISYLAGSVFDRGCLQADG
jgi:hypothetical protein